MAKTNDHEMLLELQRIDSGIDKLNLKEKKLPQRDRYAQLKEEVGKIEVLFKAMSEKLHTESIAQKRLDDELRTLNTRAEREQNRLYSGTVKNPKELSSVQQEVTLLKEQIDEKELLLLEQIEVVDKMKSDCSKVEARLKQRTVEMKAAEEELNKVLSEIHAGRESLQKERAPIYSGLSEDARSLYDRVRAKHPVAVTVLENGLCCGCRMDLPSTDYKRIEQSAKPERCTNCGRIIVKSASNN